MLRVYLDVAGQEAMVKGHMLFCWHYTVREAAETPPAGAVLLGEFEPALPRPEVCIPAILAKLKHREDEINTEAAEELMKITQRRNDIMMLGHST